MISHFAAQQLANRGPATSPSLTTQPMQIHLKYAKEAD